MYKSKAILIVGGVLFNDNGGVLLVEHLEGGDHLAGKYGLPAGKVKEGERLEQAVVRKIREETGVNVTSAIRLPTVYVAEILRANGKVETFVLVAFVCNFQKSDSDLVDKSNTGFEKPQWISYDQLENIPLLPNVKEATDQAKVYLSQH